MFERGGGEGREGKGREGGVLDHGIEKEEGVKNYHNFAARLFLNIS